MTIDEKVSSSQVKIPIKCGEARGFAFFNGYVCECMYKRPCSQQLLYASTVYCKRELTKGDRE